MTMTLTPSFAFRAQTVAGEAVTGTLDAATAEAAGAQLAGLNLRVVSLDPVRPPEPKPAAARPLRGVDFEAFNTQLAHLATAGLPVEQGLRLIAEEMRSGRLAATVRQVADELEAGRPLPEAFDRHAGQFPPLYGRLVAAGVAAGDLSGVLLNLGRHLALVGRLRSAFARALTYPAVVAAGLAAVVLFMGTSVFPQFEAMFATFKVELPAVTVVVLAAGRAMRWLVPAGAVVGVAAGVVGWVVWRSMDGPARRRAAERALLPLPLVGPALARNLLARWCDAVRLGVTAGLDLPAAISLAGDAVGSPALSRDGDVLLDALRAGRPADDASVSADLRLMPPTVPTVLALADSGHDLPAGLGTLSGMFQQQAELRVAMIPTVLTPVFVTFAAVLIGIVVLALFAPLFSLISAVSGPISHKH